MMRDRQQERSKVPLSTVDGNARGSRPRQLGVSKPGHDIEIDCKSDADSEAYEIFLILTTASCRWRRLNRVETEAFHSCLRRR